MLYLIAEQLGFPGIFNLIRYISFRAGGASATAMAIGLLLGPWFIRWLRAKQGKGQPIRADDADAAAALLKALVAPRDAVLVKASNSIGLARLVEAMAGAEPCST